MIKLESISILGCGWLGFPLAKALLKMEYPVKGSIRQESILGRLIQENIEAFLLDLETNNIKGDIGGFLRKSSTLIISIPPGLRLNSSESFFSKIKLLIPHIENSSIQNVLFISSTSVYGTQMGLINEDTAPIPVTEVGKQLLQVEQLLKCNGNFQTTILRFGGLIGEDRNPLHNLIKKNSITDADNTINFIHLDDCLGIIIQIIQQKKWNETFNAVTPYHPTKREYCTIYATENNLQLPSFSKITTKKERVISSKKTEIILGYKFLRRNLI